MGRASIYHAVSVLKDEPKSFDWRSCSNFGHHTKRHWFDRLIFEKVKHETIRKRTKKHIKLRSKYGKFQSCLYICTFVAVHSTSQGLCFFKMTSPASKCGEHVLWRRGSRPQGSCVRPPSSYSKLLLTWRFLKEMPHEGLRDSDFEQDLFGDLFG